MEYDDGAMPTLEKYEEMAKAYNISLKEKGFVFINLEEEGKNLLVDEIFDIMFKLRTSYRGMRNFMGSNAMLDLTEKHISSLRNLFGNEKNKGYFIRTNKTKCFLNSLALESMLSLKLLLLSQKCEFGSEIFSIIIDRTKHIYENLTIESALTSKMI